MSRETIGKYIDLKQIGQGGMAEVYIGQDPTLGRKVAIKLILPHLANDEDFEKRFQREAKTIAALRHANIVQIYEYAIEADGTPFMVMEFLDGGTLESVISEYRDRGEIMPLAKVADILDKIAAGLDYAHAREIIHRDIKPSNILFSDDGDPIIADFGIVKILDDSSILTRTGGVVGSPRYLPPEQASQQGVDKRGDIYSLGIVLYEMVTNEVPFDGDLISVMMQHVNQPPVDPQEHNAALPAMAAHVILTALAKQPDQRYDSAGEMAVAFRRAIEAQAALAAPPQSEPEIQPEPAALPAATAVAEPPAPEPRATPAARPVPADQSQSASTLEKKKSGLPLMLILGGLGGGFILLLIIGFFAYNAFFGGGGLATEPTNAPPEVVVQVTATNTTAPTATTAPTDVPPTEAPTATPFPEPWVQITNISIENGYYIVNYETYGYTPALPGDHIHFFYDTVTPENAGSPGSGPWALYGGPSPFTGYAVSSKPAAATQLCALYAYANHSVEQNTGNCVTLPTE